MKKSKKIPAIVYIERFFPMLSELVFIIFAFIPCIRYRLDTDVREELSLLELIGNSWEQSRSYLFSSAVERTQDGALFYKLVFSAVIICVILFIISAVFSVLSAVIPLIYYKDKTPSDNVEKAKNIYTSIISNRIVCFLFRATIIPLAFFPDLLVVFYRKILLYDVDLIFEFLHIGIIALILIIASTVITIISAKYEKRLGLDIFAKEDFLNEEAESEEEESQKDGAPLELHRMSDTSRQEQNERLRALLGRSDENENGENNTK